MLLPVIMAGGTGSRLWPMSRELHPKQFLRLYGVNSMLQETISRLDGLDVCEPVVICNEEHRFLVAEQLRQQNKLSANIILEPIGRNTAPAIALAALNAINQGSDSVMLVLAADHVITNIAAFHDAIKLALPYAQQDSLVTFGIVANGPETGYGYIHRGEIMGQIGAGPYKVEHFVEKPDIKTAEKYIHCGDYYWNSGMFMFRAERYLQELEKFRPDILDSCKKSLDSAKTEQSFIFISKEYFNFCPSESVDYAVMEMTSDAVVVPLDAGWSDVGSWSALWDLSDKDELGNALKGDTFLHNSQNCYINTDEKLVAAVGVENLVIVNTKDAILVVDKFKVQDVKKIVDYLKLAHRSEYQYHCGSTAPRDNTHQVTIENKISTNRLTVKSGGIVATKIPSKRAEYWIILTGEAKVTIGTKILHITENQLSYIPVGTSYTLENLETEPLELIKIQAEPCLMKENVV